VHLCNKLSWNAKSGAGATCLLVVVRGQLEATVVSGALVVEGVGMQWWHFQSAQASWHSKIDELRRWVAVCGLFTRTGGWEMDI
jgi:hypothetical protein